MFFVESCLLVAISSLIGYEKHDVLTHRSSALLRCVLGMDHTRNSLRWSAAKHADLDENQLHHGRLVARRVLYADLSRWFGADLVSRDGCNNSHSRGLLFLLAVLFPEKRN